MLYLLNTGNNYNEPQLCACKKVQKITARFKTRNTTQTHVEPTKIISVKLKLLFTVVALYCNPLLLVATITL
jgi:hypothetical protein